MEYLVVKNKNRYNTSLIVLFTIIGSVFFSFKPNVFSKNQLYANDSTKKDSIIISNDTVFNILNSNSIASYYAKKFIGRKTASGAKYDANALTCAHKKLKFGTKLKITNLKNGKNVIVTVNDRGPFVKNREVDLSEKAFITIAKTTNVGIVRVKVEQILEINKPKKDTLVNINELIID